MNADSRHAYLIMCHKDDYLLRRLISALDDSRNDIYIHMDSKTDCDMEQIRQIAQYSHIVVVERTDVTWGDYSQINAELILLKAALSSHHYEYLHLLSGSDFPIQTQDIIHSFFHNHRGTEFVQIDSVSYSEYKYRVERYYPLQHILGRETASYPNMRHVVFWLLNKLISSVQGVFFPRNQDIKFAKGANWFSITSNLAQYVVDREAWIKKIFSHSLNGDELFLQTIVCNSPFKNRLYQLNSQSSSRSIVRLIDWDRGSPYIFTYKDLEELAQSEMMFARKIVPSDSSFIDALYRLSRQSGTNI